MTKLLIRTARCTDINSRFSIQACPDQRLGFFKSFGSRVCYRTRKNVRGLHAKKRDMWQCLKRDAWPRADGNCIDEFSTATETSSPDANENRALRCFMLVRLLRSFFLTRQPSHALDELLQPTNGQDWVVQRKISVLHAELNEQAR